MTQKKITFKDVAPSYIYGWPGGYEIRIEKGNIPAGEMYGRNIPRESKASARNYLKGIKIVFKRANEKRAFDDVMGNFKTVEQKYNAMLKSLNRKSIEAIGSGKNFGFTGYIDGTYSAIIE